MYRSDNTLVALPEISEATHSAYHGVRYVMTINNPQDNEELINKDHPEDFGSWFHANKLQIKYMIWCLEEGYQGTKHYQCYFELVKRCKWQALKNKLRSLKVWVAPANGTVEQQNEYIGHTGK